MITIYTPEQSAAILESIQSIMLGNNGYAYLFGITDQAVIGGIRAAGFVVYLSADLHGKPCYKGWTAAAASAPASEFDRFPIIARRVQPTHDGFDYEGAILAEGERHLWA